MTSQQFFLRSSRFTGSPTPFIKPFVSMSRRSGGFSISLSRSQAGYWHCAIGGYSPINRAERRPANANSPDYVGSSPTYSTILAVNSTSGLGSRGVDASTGEIVGSFDGYFYSRCVDRQFSLREVSANPAGSHHFGFGGVDSDTPSLQAGTAELDISGFQRKQKARSRWAEMPILLLTIPARIYSFPSGESR